MRFRTGLFLLSTAAFALTVPAGAFAASSVLTHADGSRTEIISHKGSAQIKTFDKSGKLTGKTLDESGPTSGGGHYLFVDKYKKAGDKVTTTR